MASSEAAMEVSSWRARPSTALSAPTSSAASVDGVAVEVGDGGLEGLRRFDAPCRSASTSAWVPSGSGPSAAASAASIDRQLLREHDVEQLGLALGADVFVLLRAAGGKRDGRAGGQGRAGSGKHAAAREAEPEWAKPSPAVVEAAVYQTDGGSAAHAVWELTRDGYSAGGSDRGAERARHLVPCLSAAGRVARGGSLWTRRALSRRGLLGAAGARVRRPRRADPDRRPGARGAWREPHGAHVHGRPLRRLALRRAAPRRPGEPADQRGRGRRAAPARRVHQRDRALRAAGQQADDRRTGRVHPVPGRGAGAAPARAA